MVARMIGVAAAVGVAAVCHADLQQFTFTYQDAAVQGSGWLSAIDVGNGVSTATQGQFSISSGALAGLYDLVTNPGGTTYSTSAAGAFWYDDVVYPGAPTFMNIYGLLFSDGTREINIWGNGDGQPYSLWSWSGGHYDYSSNQGGYAMAPGGGPAAPSPSASACLVIVGAAVGSRRTRRPSRR